jgi:nucleoside-diphosphate-sugar epimerase
LRILFTGASSFTGMWFVEALARRGHSITAVSRGDDGSYSGLRAQRLARIAGVCSVRWNAPFGAASFLDIVAKDGPFDVLCHHGAETQGYRSRDFDYVGAVASNTRALPQVLAALRNANCTRIILTGSIFESGEGAGTTPLRPFNAYGLSKNMTSQVFEFHAGQENFALGKFVIPNPFGPFEEPRFTDYLIRSWRDGKTAVVSTPRYVRDNIHVALLSECYCDFVQSLPPTGRRKMNPSGYAESQAAFAARFAREIATRLKLDTPLEMTRQRIFDEPAVRINTDAGLEARPDWDEREAWAELADYYAGRFDIVRR